MARRRDATHGGPDLFDRDASVGVRDLHASRDPDADALARRRWRRLIESALPQAAVGRPDWPIRRDHCFARVVLDTVYGRPWRAAIAPPAWRTMAPAALAAAIAVAEAILDGSADLRSLNDASLVMRRRGV